MNMSNDQAFDRNLVRGLGQLPANDGSDGGDGGLTTVSGYDANGNPLPPSSNLVQGGDGTDSGDGTGGGTTSGGGGGGGTTSGGTTASTAASGITGSISNALTSAGGTPTLVIGGIALIGGIAAIAYLANRHHAQTGGGRHIAGRHIRGTHRSAARRR
jgi:hypothetical protein